MKNMLRVLFGNLKFLNKTDYIAVPLKMIYIIYSLPFLLISFVMMARSAGAFGSPDDEKFGIVKTVLLHISNIFLSFVLWEFLINVVFRELL